MESLSDSSSKSVSGFINSESHGDIVKSIMNVLISQKNASVQQMFCVYKTLQTKYNLHISQDICNDLVSQLSADIILHRLEEYNYDVVRREFKSAFESYLTFHHNHISIDHLQDLSFCKSSLLLGTADIGTLERLFSLEDSADFILGIYPIIKNNLNIFLLNVSRYDVVKRQIFWEHVDANLFPALDYEQSMRGYDVIHEQDMTFINLHKAPSRDQGIFQKKTIIELLVGLADLMELHPEFQGVYMNSPLFLKIYKSSNIINTFLKDVPISMYKSGSGGCMFLDRQFLLDNYLKK